ncbi:MAG: patatin-like protein [Microthrixaceae bacterium]|nr:patatin-like protein [Microthrixaceae bacterium]
MEPGTELRLALAMRGGVSLAIWMGGACGEIDELRRGDNEFWSELTSSLGFERVVVDVLTGASAGGLNGVLFASALRHGFKMSDLRGVWGQLASVKKIARRTGPWDSLFDGDTSFLKPLEQALGRLVSRTGSGSDSESPEPCDFIDLQLTATLVEPLHIPTYRLDDEQLWTKRSAASFRFKHHSGGVLPQRDLEADDASRWRLAVAARSTSSFPGAFEPAIVRSRRPERFGEQPPTAPGPLVDCRGVFSEANGTVTSTDRADFVVADGGILDNIPIARAVEAIAASPASGPTKRVLIYLHPTGPTEPPPELTRRSLVRGARIAAVRRKGIGSNKRVDSNDSRRGIWPVLTALKSTMIRSETIDGDLAELQALNDGVRRTRMMREAALQREQSFELEPDFSQFALVWATYLNQRASSDADVINTLLDDPIKDLGSDPFPETRNQNRWRAPLSHMDTAERTTFTQGIASAYKDRMRQRSAAGWTEATFAATFITDISALERVVDLTLEWTRSLPTTDCTRDVKPTLYHLRSLIEVIARVRKVAWVVVASKAKPTDAQLVLDSVEGMTRVPSDLAERVVAMDGTAVEFLDHVNRLLQDVNDSLEHREGINDHPPELKVMAGMDYVVRDTGPDDSDIVDLRSTIAEVLVDEVSKLCVDAMRLEQVDSPSTALLHFLMTGHTGINDGEGGGEKAVERSAIKDRLIALEIEGLGEQLSGCIRGEETELFRISAVAKTPLADEFNALKKRSAELDRVKKDGWTTSADFLRPEVKLAGNELANFSAFLDARWRNNDWMWGRLDAASDLVTMMMNSAGLNDDDRVPSSMLKFVGRTAGLSADSSVGDLRDALIRSRQLQILEEILEDPTDLAEYAIGLESPTRHSGWSVPKNVQLTLRNAGRVIRKTVPLPIAVLVAPLSWIVQVVATALTVPRRWKVNDPFKPDPTESGGIKNSLP